METAPAGVLVYRRYVAVWTDRRGEVSPRIQTLISIAVIGGLSMMACLPGNDRRDYSNASSDLTPTKNPREIDRNPDGLRKNETKQRARRKGRRS